MVHQRQRLPLGLEPGDDPLGVHSQLDDFEGDPPVEGLLLLGHIHHPAPAFTDCLKEPVVPNLLAGLIPQQQFGRSRNRPQPRRLHELPGRLMGAQQGLDALAHRRIPGAGPFEERRPLRPRQLEGALKDLANRILRWSHVIARHAQKRNP